MTIHRRLVLGGMAATAAVLAAPAARAATAQSWLAYDARLHARLADAGGGVFEPAIEAEVLAQTNAFRHAVGRAPLRHDEELTMAARAHAADMSQRNYFGHTTTEGFTNTDRSGLVARSFIGFFGENLAYHHAVARRPWTAEEILVDWKNSGAHRANLTRLGFTHAGHGVVRSNGRWFAAAVYGGLSARLNAPLPLQVGAGAIGRGLTRAKPEFGGFIVSEPHGEPPEQVWTLSGRSPGLGAGAWRLRPIMQASEELASGQLTYGQLVGDQMRYGAAGGARPADAPVIPSGASTAGGLPANGRAANPLPLNNSAGGDPSLVNPLTDGPNGSRRPGGRQLGADVYEVLWGPIVVV